MNSMSKNRCHDEDPCCKHFEDDCCEHSHKLKKAPHPAVLKCGNPGSAVLNIPTTGSGTPVTVASLTVNTSCFCNPCIKLEFASNIINTSVAALSGSVTFQIFKQCNNQFQPTAIGPQWIYSRILLAGIAAADTFTFFICDCDSCFNDCCTYTVVATPSAIGAGIGTITVANAELAAIITDAADKCGC